MAEIMTKAQREVMEHTLGLNRCAEPYRNYFFCSEGHDDLPTIRELEAAGWMERFNNPHSKDMGFRVTATGRAALAQEDQSRG